MTRLLLLSALAALALGCSADPGSDAPATFPAEPFATLASETGALTIEVRTAPEQPPTRGLASVEYRITEANMKPAEGLTLSVVPWMPNMGHGASITPSVAAEGDGRYVVSDVELFMPGKWELRTTISGADDDSAMPTFEIQ
jgi:hypothetical protein